MLVCASRESRGGQPPTSMSKQSHWIRRSILNMTSCCLHCNIRFLMKRQEYRDAVIDMDVHELHVIHRCPTDASIQWICTMQNMTYKKNVRTQPLSPLLLHSNPLQECLLYEGLALWSEDLGKVHIELDDQVPPCGGGGGFGCEGHALTHHPLAVTRAHHLGNGHTDGAAVQCRHLNVATC